MASSRARRSSVEDGARIIVTAKAGRPAMRRGFMLLIVTNLLWAGTYVTGKIALGQLSSVELNAIRFSIVILHDTLNWATLVGAGLICASLLLVIVGNVRQSPSIVVNEYTP